MHLNEQTANTNEEKAELFNLFFQSVFNSKRSKVENQFNFEEKGLNRFDISEKEIESIQNKLDTSKANGPDDVSNLLLKNLTKTLSRSLLLLFQTFINKGKFPAYWKQSDITPIHKEGNKATINMYRPINCLCCLSKVFEKLMFNKLYEHVKGTLHNSQFGFRPQRSAITQMLCFLDQLYKEYDSIAHDEFFFFYLDFQKAFDTIPHHSVVSILSESGIGGKALSLIANYCDDKIQRVRIGTSKSSLRDVTSGVPQGSILGPLIFLVYINDLQQKIEYSQTYGYADDYKLLSNNKHELQIDLQKLNEWCNNNEMRLHENESKILCFEKKLLFTIKNETLKISSHQKILEYKFVITSRGIKTQAREPPKLLKHFGTSEEIFTTELSLKLN